MSRLEPEYTPGRSRTCNEETLKISAYCQFRHRGMGRHFHFVAGDAVTLISGFPSTRASTGAWS